MTALLKACYIISAVRLLGRAILLWVKDRGDHKTDHRNIKKINHVDPHETNEPCLEKTNVLHMRKQRRRSALR